MLTLLFAIMMVLIFGKLLVFGIKVSWGLTKIIFTLILLPFILIFLVIAGFIYIAIPILAIVGIVALFVKE